MKPGVVSCLEARLLVGYGDVVRLDLKLKFDPSDPFAVHAIFQSDGLEVEWVFARALLKAGTIQAVGSGDVHIWPAWSRKVVSMVLSSPDGSATLELDAKQVTAFLDSSEILVPFGAEVQDVDAILSRIFGAVAK